MTDLQIRIANELKSKYTKDDMMDSCKSIVVPRFFMLNLPDIIDNQESMGDNQKTCWSKLLSDVDLNSSQLTDIILSSFGYYNGGNEIYINTNTNSIVPKDCVMIWAATPTRVQMNNLEKLFKKTLGPRGYEIFKANSDNTSNKEIEEEVKNKIERCKKNGTKLIILSRNMASRSFSISEIETEFIWYDGGSSEATNQRISRVFTNGYTWDGLKKKYGNVLSFSFDPSREDTTPIDDYLISESEKTPNNELGDSIKRTLNSAYIFKMDENGLLIEFTEDDKSEYVEKLISSSSLLKVAESGINPMAIDEDDDSMFDVIISEDAKSEVKGINRTNINKSVGGKTKNSSNISDEDKEERNSVKLRREALKSIVKNIISITEINNIESDSMAGIMNDISKKGLDSELINEVGVNSSTILKWIYNGAFNLKLMNTIITSYNYHERNDISNSEISNITL